MSQGAIIFRAKANFLGRNQLAAKNEKNIFGMY